MFLDPFTLQQKDESNSSELFKHCSQALTSAITSSRYIKSLIYGPDFLKKLPHLLYKADLNLYINKYIIKV